MRANAREEMPVKPVPKKDRRKVLVIGAHPDDADTGCAGILGKLLDAGWEARLVSVTDGGAGTYRTDLPREELAAIRRKEAANMHKRRMPRILDPFAKEGEA